MSKKIILVILFSCATLFSSESYYYSNNKKVYLTPVYTQTTNKVQALSMKKNIRYYQTSTNNILGVSNSIIVNFMNLQNFDEIKSKYQLSMIKKLYGSVYIFEIRDNSKIFDIANRLYMEENIKYAHPNFIKSVKKR